MKVYSHGVEIEVNKDVEVIGVIQTTSGTVLFLSSDDGNYAVYSPVKSKPPHIHFPLRFIEYDDDVLEFKDFVVSPGTNAQSLSRVLTDVTTCIKNGGCYIDFVTGMARSVSPIVPWLNKKKFKECMKYYNDEDMCSLYRGAPVRLLEFTPPDGGTKSPLEPD